MGLLLETQPPSWDTLNLSPVIADIAQYISRSPPLSVWSLITLAVKQINLKNKTTTKMNQTETNAYFLTVTLFHELCEELALQGCQQFHTNRNNFKIPSPHTVRKLALLYPWYPEHP